LAIFLCTFFIFLVICPYCQSCHLRCVHLHVKASLCRQPCAVRASPVRDHLLPAQPSHSIPFIEVKTRILWRLNLFIAGMWKQIKPSNTILGVSSRALYLGPNALSTIAKRHENGFRVRFLLLTNPWKPSSPLRPCNAFDEWH
jgi:hypothetical protein